MYFDDLANNIKLPPEGPGQTGGHVGLLTGNVRGDQAEMVEGNSGHAVRKKWENISSMVVRRYHEELAKHSSRLDLIPHHYAALASHVGARLAAHVAHTNNS